MHVRQIQGKAAYEKSTAFTSIHCQVANQCHRATAIQMPLINIVLTLEQKKTAASIQSPMTSFSLPYLFV